MRENTVESIRVRYDHRETGWALPLGHDLALVENVPVSHRCNLGDVVRLESPEPPGTDGLPWVAEVVHQRYPEKTLLYYYGSQERHLLCGLLKLLDCAVEDARHPLDLTPGLLLVAHDRNVCPALLARAAGVPQPSGTPRRIAIEGGTLVADSRQLRLETSEGEEVACWDQAAWTAQPELAVGVLDTLQRCLAHGIEEAREPLEESDFDSEPRWRGSGPGLAERPLTVRFRRWRHLG